MVPRTTRAHAIQIAERALRRHAEVARRRQQHVHDLLVVERVRRAGAVVHERAHRRPERARPVRHAQRHEADKAAQAAPPKPAGPIRDGSLVKLRSADKKFDGQVGRVVDTNVKFAHTQQGLISVLLAPKGTAQGVWVAVPPECLILQ